MSLIPIYRLDLQLNLIIPSFNLRFKKTSYNLYVILSKIFHLRKLRDLCPPWPKDLWSIDCSFKSGISIETIHDAQKSENISRVIQQDISLTRTTKLSIENKKILQKDFDALEKRGEILSFFRKDINLRPKTSKIKDYTQNFKQSWGSLLLKLRSYQSSVSIFFSKLTMLWYLSLILVMISAAFLLLFVIKFTIESKVNSGYQTLQEISKGWQEFTLIAKNINKVRFDFLLADTLFIPFRALSDPRLKSVGNVISGGRELTYTLDNWLSLLIQIEAFMRSRNLTDIYWVHLLERLRPNISRINLSLTETLMAYKNITWLPNKSLEDQKNNLIMQLEKMKYYSDILESDYDTILSLLGKEERKQYLLVFQNADEIRPTGWFMGSMAIISMFRWKVDIFQKKDVYAIEWDLKVAEYERQIAPKGINELTEFFWLRDANYFVNTRDSAEAIEFFIDQAWIDIDGVIFINQNSLVRLLSITGPVYFDLLKRDISKNNFSEIMSLLVESKVFQLGTLGTPKQVVFDFIPVFLTALKEQGKYTEYLKFLLAEIENREILVWFFDEEAQNLSRELWLIGDIHYSDSLDFWYPVYTSISWNKSDRYMQRSYSYNITPWEACGYNVSVEMSATHAMTKVHRDQMMVLKNEFWLEESEELTFIQWAGRNRQYVRYLLPKDTSILSFESWEFVDYGSRKWLEFFIETPLLQTSRYSFSYKLLNPDCRPYSLKHYKQPGIKSYDISINFDGDITRYTDLTNDFYFEE